jgi:hypothetical protein
VNREVSGFEVLVVLAGGAGFFVVGATWGTDAAHALVIAMMVVGLAGEPLLVLAHELGHATAGVWLTGRPVRVQIGDPPFRLRFAIGRIRVEYAPGGYLAHCVLDDSSVVTGRAFLLTALAGPAVNLALAAVLGGLALIPDDRSSIAFWLLALSAGGSLLMGLVNLIPLRGLPAWWPGTMSTEEHLSDGYLVLLALTAGLGNVLSAPEPRRVLGEDASRALVAAASAAYSEQASMIETSHLLVGLYAEGQGVASRILRESGYRAAAPPAYVPPNQLEVTPAVKRVFHRAKDLLTLRGDEYIDTEHLLLSLIEDPDGPADRLTGLGVDRTQLRRRLLEALAR